MVDIDNIEFEEFEEHEIDCMCPPYDAPICGIQADAMRAAGTLPPRHECARCDGDSTLWFWWYRDEEDEEERCALCGKDAICRSFNHYGDVACFVCSVKRHRRLCGCELWASAELALGLRVPEGQMAMELERLM